MTNLKAIFPNTPKRKRGSRTDKCPLGLPPIGVARKLGFSHNLICRAIESGDIETVSFGGHTYIPYGEIKRLEALIRELNGD